jgi:hypothetical protein
VKSTTSANRIEAEFSWSAIGCVDAFSRSAIERGRMLSNSPSDFACSTRRAARASRRSWANTARRMNTIAPPTVMLRASIVVVNNPGIAGGMAPSISPRNPEVRNTTAYARYQRAADRTSLNTRAPKGARIPHSPTPPDWRNPPSGIIDRVGASRMST